MFVQRWFLLWIVLAAVFSPCHQLFQAQTLPLLVQQLNSKIAEYVTKSHKYKNEIFLKRSNECLEVHLPRLEALTADHEADYENCLRASELARLAADNKAEKHRINLENTIFDVCLKFDECDAYESITDFMKCTEANAVQASRTFHQVMDAAGTAKKSLDYEYTTIAYTERTCTDDLYSAYKRQTDDVIADLKKCLEIQ